MLRREEQDIHQKIEYDWLKTIFRDFTDTSFRCIWLPQGTAELALLLQLYVLKEENQSTPPKIIITTPTPQNRYLDLKLPIDSAELADFDNTFIHKYFTVSNDFYYPKKIFEEYITFAAHEIACLFEVEMPELVIYSYNLNTKPYQEQLYDIASMQLVVGDASPYFFFSEKDASFFNKQQFLIRAKNKMSEGLYIANEMYSVENMLETADTAHLQVLLKLNKLTTGLLKERTNELNHLHTTIEEHNKSLEASNEALYKTNEEITESFSKLQQVNSLLKTNEVFINAVFQVADVGLSILDAQGKMMRVNKEFCNIYLFNENELIQLPIERLIPNSDTCKYIYGEEGQLTKSLISDVSKGIRKDGKHILVLNSTTRVVSEDGETFYINTARDITKTTRDLHLLHDTLSSLQIGGWEYDLHSNQLFHTDELKFILETTYDVAKENQIRQFIPHKEFTELKDSFRQITLNKGTFIKELHAITAKGNAKVLKVTARCIFHNDVLIKFAGTVQDITNAKIKERKTKENEQLFKTLIANFPGGTIDIIDKDFKYVFTGGKELEDLPQNPEDVFGKSIYELYDSELADKLESYLKRCLQGEQLTFDIDYEGKYWNVFAIPLYNEFEDIDKVMVLTQNITLQRKADKGLKETHKSLSDFRKALDVASYVAILNEKAEFNYLNENLVGLSGFSLEELVNQSFEKILDKEKIVATFFEEIKDILLSGEIWQGELICIDKNQENFWLNMSIIPFLDESGTPYQFLAVGNNDTVRKKAEEQIKIQNKELTRINAELDRFVYSTSHDIRSPLVSILGLINIARLELKEGDVVDGYLGMIEKSVKKLDKFVQEIIHYSQNARMEVKYEQIDFESLVQEVFEGLKQVDGYNNIKLIIDCKTETPFFTDSNRLRVALNNLLANAILYQRKSIDDPYVEVKVEADKNIVSIIVKDNGIGISKEYIDKVFDMFFKATTFSSGSGLGLYVVKESMTILDGDISVVSKQNEGATFTMNIPNGARNLDIIS